MRDHEDGCRRQVLACLPKTLAVAGLFMVARPFWLAAAFAEPASPMAEMSSASALHVDGAELKDAAGKIIMLHGVNHHGFVDVPDGAWDAPGQPLYSGMGRWDPSVVKGTLKDYRKLGFNVVRFHTIVDWWKKNPQTYKDSWRSVTYPEPYRRMIKDTVQWAGECGLYVIFDFYAMKNVKGKQSGQESLPWPPYNRYPDVVASRAEFMEIWKSVAQELGPFPNVIFEFYNEPHGDDKAQAEWFSFCQEGVAALRAGAKNLIIVQWDYQCWVNLDYPPPLHPASTLAWIEGHPLRGENLVYGTHLYRNSGGGGPGAIHRTQHGLVNLWDLPDVRQGLELALFPHSVRDLKKAVLVTEIGADLKHPGGELSHELAWFRNTLAVLRDWGVGYVGWAWQSDEQIDHGMLHRGIPNEGGNVFLDSMSRVSP